MLNIKKQVKISKKQLENWYSQSVAERNSSNNQVIDKRLIQWEEMLDNIPVRKIKPFHIKTNFVFFHIPKTAGTTLDFIISKNLPVWGIFKQHGPDFDKNVAAFYKAGVGPKAVLGHNELNDYFYQLLDRERLVNITYLRDPVKRVVSYYDFLRSQENHPGHKLASRLSLSDFIKSSHDSEVRNAQSNRILGLLKNTEYKKDKRSVEQLSKDAINQLFNRFTLFGITEKFDKSLLILGKLLKWNDIYYQRQNVTNKKFKTDVATLDSSITDIIKEHNEVDMALYAAALNEFENRCEQLSITDEKVENFQLRNREFQKLLNLNNSLL